MGDVDEVLMHPREDYTRTLIASAPSLEAAFRTRTEAQSLIDANSNGKVGHGSNT